MGGTLFHRCFPWKDLNRARFRPGYHPYSRAPLISFRMHSARGSVISQSACSARRDFAAVGAVVALSSLIGAKIPHPTHGI